MEKASIWALSQAYHLDILVFMPNFHKICFLYTKGFIVVVSAEMGKGRHQMPTREQLMKKYNQKNKMKEVIQIYPKLDWMSSFSFSLILYSWLILGTAGTSQVSP